MKWNPVKRDFEGMKRWINKTAGDSLQSINAQPAGANALSAASAQLASNYRLNNALPIADGSANSAYFQAQAEENKHMSEILSQIMEQ